LANLSLDAIPVKESWHQCAPYTVSGGYGAELAIGLGKWRRRDSGEFGGARQRFTPRPLSGELGVDITLPPAANPIARLRHLDGAAGIAGDRIDLGVERARDYNRAGRGKRQVAELFSTAAVAEIATLPIVAEQLLLGQGRPSRYRVRWSLPLWHGFEPQRLMALFGNWPRGLSRFAC
jgi:hypothetical protein